MSEAPWRVTAMSATDLPAVCRIENQSPAPWSQQQLAEELTAPGALPLVCRMGAEGLVAGFLMARLLLDEAEILKIATSSEFRRQGAADQMLKAFIGLVKQRGICRCHLELRAQNRAALALYEKHAFGMTGRRRNYYTAPNDDALCMTLSLVNHVDQPNGSGSDRHDTVINRNPCQGDLFREEHPRP